MHVSLNALLLDYVVNLQVSRYRLMTVSNYVCLRYIVLSLVKFLEAQLSKLAKPSVCSAAN